MNKRLAILGAGGHGKVVADAAMLSGGWSEIVFFDVGYPSKKTNGHWSIKGRDEELLASLNEFDGVVVAIGNNELRLEKTRRLLDAGANIVSIIHPSAVISSFATIGVGSVVFSGAIVNVDAKVGMACIINSGAVIEHDCHLGGGVHASPNATLSGGSVVGDRSWIGASAVSKQLINIAADVIIGAGSVVVKNIPDGVTVIGNPAIPLLKIK